MMVNEWSPLIQSQLPEKGQQGRPNRPQRLTGRHGHYRQCLEPPVAVQTRWYDAWCGCGSNCTAACRGWHSGHMTCIVQFPLYVHLAWHQLCLCMRSCRPLLCRFPDFYKRNRHRIIIGQRLLRLMGMLLAVYQSSNGLQAALARALDVQAKATAAAPANMFRSVLNLTRPLFLAPVLTAAHVSAGRGLQTKLAWWWVPETVIRTRHGTASINQQQQQFLRVTLCVPPPG